MNRDPRVRVTLDITTASIAKCSPCALRVSGAVLTSGNERACQGSVEAQPKTILSAGRAQAVDYRDVYRVFVLDRSDNHPGALEHPEVLLPKYHAYP
ncbi:hypothetical protein J1614_007532 [Plenodomus biglobosus]|nr:hypothetical protein J1614_007532 [Plenodomus biglobosus]